MIDIQYVPSRRLENVLRHLQQQTNQQPLLLMLHNDDSILKDNIEQLKKSLKQDFIILHSGLNSLDVDQENSADCEIWMASGNWTSATDGTIAFMEHKDYLVASMVIPLEQGSSLQEKSYQCYQQILSFIQAKGKPHLIRMWNYFPHINQHDDQYERYQQFCVGRYEAFEHSPLYINETLPPYPAASAVGAYGERKNELVISFIAQKKDVLLIENPDQMSAYHYPQCYSPKSPSFARASLLEDHKKVQLYVSGTASIIGHKSYYMGDIKAQIQQIINNLKRLFKHSMTQSSYFPEELLEQSHLWAVKVYLRKPSDQQKVQTVLQQFMPNCTNICYLQADICRQELDVEIELLLKV